MAYADAMEEAWCAFVEADTMEEGRWSFDAMSKATWALKETQELEVTQATKLSEERPGPSEEQLSTHTSLMTNMSAKVDCPSSSSLSYAATTTPPVLGGAKQAELVGSSRQSSETQYKPIYSNYVPAQMDKHLEVLDFPSSMDLVAGSSNPTTRKRQGLAEACHKDETEVHREAAFMDWRRRAGNTREELWRSYRDTKPKAKRILREFLDKAQKKAMEMAVILNAKNHRTGIQVVEKQKKAMDLITTSNAKTKDMLEAQKKITNVIVNSNAENLHADTQVEVKALGPRKAMECPRPSTPLPPWCTTRVLP